MHIIEVSPEMFKTEDDGIWIRESVDAGIIPAYVGEMMLRREQERHPHVSESGSVVNAGYSDMDAFEDALLDAMGFEPGGSAGGNELVGKQAELDQIKADIIKNNVCPNLAESATQLVFGDGNPDADLLFIGEAPGKKEDEQGLPFVGASGKFLAEMLESIHLTRSQVYITNIVKYRPPNNRDPELGEKKEFLPYLLKQIEVIKPKLIICLGRHSGMQFLPDLRISQDHGQPKRISLKLENRELKVVVLPLYHPAAALYNGGQRQTLMADFALIPEILKKINSN